MNNLFWSYSNSVFKKGGYFILNFIVHGYQYLMIYRHIKESYNSYL